MNTLPPPAPFAHSAAAATVASSASATSSATITSSAPVALAWRDCLHMSPEVAAIVMGVTLAQAEACLRAAATRRSRHDRAADVAGDFKHSALAFTTPGHAPLTQTYRLILNKPVAETYLCRGCKLSQPLPDSGLQSLCVSCSAALQERLVQEKKQRAERSAKSRAALSAARA